MQNRHRAKLQDKLDELYCNCKVVLSMEEIRLWYGMKVTKTVWQKIDDEFRNLLRETHVRMPKYTIHVSIINEEALLILSKYKKNSYLSSLNDLME